MGYSDQKPSGLLRHYGWLDDLEQTTILLAEEHETGELMGTCSFTLDNPHGLHVDVDFPVEMRILRDTHAGKIIGAAWRIVTRHERCTLRAMKMLQRMIAMLVWESADILVCSFNPRHAKYYRHIWGLSLVADRVATPSVNGAPSALMMVDADTLMQTHRRNTRR
jgi:hypothetical protein